MGVEPLEVRNLLAGALMAGPIVLISDLPEKSLEEMFPSSGANAWMRKPLTRDKMVDMINRYVK